MEKLNDQITFVENKHDSLEQFAKAYDSKGVDLYELQLQQRNVPDLKRSDYGDNRLNANPTGMFQRAIKYERQSLVSALDKYANEASKYLPQSMNLSELKEIISYIPNARFTWFNKIIKKILAGEKILQGDVDYVRTVWMSPNLKDGLIKFMQHNASPQGGFSFPPIQPKSGLVFEDASGKGTLALRLANPGSLLLGGAENRPEELNRQQVENSANKFFQGLDRAMALVRKKMQDLSKQAEIVEATKDMYKISDNAFNPVVRTLEFYRDKLSSGSIEVKDLLSISDSIQKYVGARKSRYLMSLADPFNNRTARIPTLLSPPSATFSIKSLIPLTTNALGNVAFAYNPFFLDVTPSVVTSFSVNNNVALTGSAIANFFTGVDVGQSLPAAFYVRYRVVSAALRLYCYPSSNNDQGIVTISATFENIGTIAAAGVNGTAQQWSLFSAIENGYYKKTTTVASREVQEHVYIPIDETKWAYSPVATAVDGYGWVGYITGAAASSNVARIEIITNYEALLDNTYTDYLPSDTPLADLEPQQISSVLRAVKNNPIANDSQKITDTLKETNKAFLPDTQINLPVSREQLKDLQEAKNAVEDSAKQLAIMAKPIIAVHPNKQEAESWTDKLTGFLSEIGHGLYDVGSKIATDTFFPMARRGLEEFGTGLVSALF
jgi:hypothetical protein